MTVDEIQYPTDGVLDLHMFAPRDAASVVDGYLKACWEQGIIEVKGLARERGEAGDGEDGQKEDGTVFRQSA